MATKTGKAVLIEHGATRFDHEGRTHGAKFDEPLSPGGRKQAEALGKKLQRAKIKPAVLYHSPLKRTTQTAQIVGGLAGIPIKKANPLAALDVGDFAGQKESEAAKKLEPYFAHPSRTIPGGESVDHWHERTLPWMLEKTKMHALAGEIPGYVTHSSTITSFQAAAHGGKDGLRGMRQPPKNAHAYPVQVPLKPGKFRLPGAER